MGQVADDILDGLMCQVCGQWMEDVYENSPTFIDPPGYPRTCDECKDEKEE